MPAPSERAVAAPVARRQSGALVCLGITPDLGRYGVRLSQGRRAAAHKASRVPSWNSSRSRMRGGLAVSSARDAISGTEECSCGGSSGSAKSSSASLHEFDARRMPWLPVRAVRGSARRRSPLDYAVMEKASRGGCRPARCRLGRRRLVGRGARHASSGARGTRRTRHSGQRGSRRFRREATRRHSGRSGVVGRRHARCAPRRPRASSEKMKSLVEAVRAAGRADLL